MSTGTRWSSAGAGTLALVMSLSGVAGAQDTRVDAPIPHDVGQSLSASFEGWYQNPDGTRSLVFGYFNRNYDEHLDLPVGPDNRFEPGPADRGQPTHFLPRRQTGVFAAVVPADFGDQRLTWTLTAHGETIGIPGHLRPEWDQRQHAAGGAIRWSGRGAHRPGSAGCSVPLDPGGGVDRLRGADHRHRLGDRRRRQKGEGVRAAAPARGGLEQVSRAGRRHLHRCRAGDRRDRPCDDDSEVQPAGRLRPACVGVG